MDRIGDKEGIENSLSPQNQSQRDRGDDFNQEMDAEDVVPGEEDKDHISEEATVDSLTYLPLELSNYRSTPDQVITMKCSTHKDE